MIKRYIPLLVLVLAIIHPEILSMEKDEGGSPKVFEKGSYWDQAREKLQKQKQAKNNIKRAIKDQKSLAPEARYEKKTKAEKGGLNKLIGKSLSTEKNTVPHPNVSNIGDIIENIKNNDNNKRTFWDNYGRYFIGAVTTALIVGGIYLFNKNHELLKKRNPAQ